MGAVPTTVAELLQAAEKILLVSWNPFGAEEECTRCAQEAIVVANGQQPTEWSRPKGLAAEALALTDDLVSGESHADDEDGWPWTERTCDFNDMAAPGVEEEMLGGPPLSEEQFAAGLTKVTDLFEDAIAIAQAEGI